MTAAATAVAVIAIIIMISIAIIIIIINAPLPSPCGASLPVPANLHTAVPRASAQGVHLPFWKPARGLLMEEQMSMSGGLSAAGELAVLARHGVRRGHYCMCLFI